MEFEQSLFKKFEAVCRCYRRRDGERESVQRMAGWSGDGRSGVETELVFSLTRVGRGWVSRRRKSKCILRGGVERLIFNDKRVNLNSDSKCRTVEGDVRNQ